MGQLKEADSAAGAAISMSRAAEAALRAKREALGAALKEIEKNFGKGAVLCLGDRAAMRVEALPTGLLPLDLALGVGGIPRGRVVEVYGPESGGKTTITLHAVAEAQRRGEICAFIDAEHALDPAYAAKIGVQLDRLWVSQPGSGEEALEIADSMVRSGAIGVLVIDSVAALVPRAEIEGEMGDSHVGLQARMMSQALRKLTASVSRTKTIVFFINQLREKIGVMFGSPETTPGGRALKFYSSVRLDVRGGETLRRGDEVIGRQVKVKVAKNKVAAPFKTAIMEMRFGHGVSREAGLLDLGIACEAVVKKGAWLEFDGASLGQGREAAISAIAGDAKLSGALSARILERSAASVNTGTTAANLKEDPKEAAA